MKPYQHH